MRHPARSTYGVTRHAESGAASWPRKNAALGLASQLHPNYGAKRRSTGQYEQDRKCHLTSLLCLPVT